MATPVPGDPHVDTKAEAILDVVELVCDKFLGVKDTAEWTLKNLKFETQVRAATFFFEMYETVLPYVYEKFMQSAPRRADLEAMTRLELGRTYGPIVIQALDAKLGRVGR